MSDAIPAPAPATPPLGVDRETFTLAYVAAHEAQCPACGYNMHALTIPRCPECGRPFEVRLVAPGNFPKAWTVLLITTAIGAGIGLLLAADAIREGLPPRRGRSEIRIGFIYFMLNIPVPLIVFFLRKPFRRIPDILKFVICIIAILVTYTMIYYFFSHIG